MNPLKVANFAAQAVQDKQAGKKSPKQVAAAKEQEKAKGKIPPKTAAQARAKMPKPSDEE